MYKKAYPLFFMFNFEPGNSEIITFHEIPA